MERFDKDPEIHFKDLTQLKQTGSAETFISKFQRISIMVFDISETRLIMLFMEALSEPLCGWVKAYRPITLQDTISRTLDPQDSMPKNKHPQKTTSLPENKEKPTHFQKIGKG